MTAVTPACSRECWGGWMAKRLLRSPRFLTVLLVMGLAFPTFSEDSSHLTRLKRRFAYLENALNVLKDSYVHLFRTMEEREGRVVDEANVAEGRLTLETGVAISTTNQSNMTTIYYTPYMGNNVALYNGTSWTIATFTERSLALAGLVSAGNNYDVFLYNNAGTLTLELSNAWTNNVTRSQALASQGGVLVKSGTTSRRYLGTIRGTGAGQTQDKANQRFTWNYQNRVPRSLQINDTADNWAYVTNGWRSADASATNRVEFVTGESDVLVEVAALSLAAGSAATLNYYSTGVGLDTTTQIDSQLRGSGADNGVNNQIWGEYKGYSGIGYHYLQWVERSAGTSVTIYGDNGNATLYQSGLLGEIGG